MVSMPEPVLRLISHPNTSKTLACVSPDGRPHMIVCGTLMAAAPDTLVLGEAFMYRSSAFISLNPNVEFMVHMGREAYSIKAVAQERVTEGPEFDKIAERLDRFNLEPKAIWRFKTTEIWDEGASKTAGERIA